MIEKIIPVLEMMLRHGHKLIGGADHDVIYGPCHLDVSEGDRKTLEENGWHLDESIGCWCIYV